MLATRGALLRLAALLGVHEEEQGASELLVVALRFGNLKDGAVMRVKKSPKLERKTMYNNHGNQRGSGASASTTEWSGRRTTSR